MIRELTIRDYFAATATDVDIENLKNEVLRVTEVRVEGTEKRLVYNVLPDNWRQVARYIHADKMLKYRESLYAKKN